MRVRLIELFVVVGVIAFATVSLKQADPLFETLFFSFTLAAILVATLLAIARRDADRAFWAAFALTSGLYLTFAHIPDSDGMTPRHDGPEITTQVLRLVFNWTKAEQHYETNFSPPEIGGFFSVQDQLSDERDPHEIAGSGSDPFATDADGEEDNTRSEPVVIEPFPTNLSLVIGGGQRVVSSSVSSSFMRIGHCEWALLLAWMAGHFTQYVHTRTRCTDASTGAKKPAAAKA